MENKLRSFFGMKEKSYLPEVKKTIEGSGVKGLAAMVKKLNKKDADEALRFAALLGADREIQIILKNRKDLKVLPKHIKAAKGNFKQEGHGGHDFAGMYLEALKRGAIKPTDNFNRLKMVKK